ncbi:MAG TPA: alpha/beta fold hydrolase [Polyangiaceae bacterium]|nr:alpha/beta fold hydrolase [Polyangiaceae bacterium]
MTITRRRSGLVLTSVVSLFLGHYVWRGWSACHPPRHVVTAEERSEARAELPGLEEISFTGDGGAILRGWFAPPTNGSVVVFVHGLEGNRASLLPEAEVLARHGYGALLFDGRASGESGGDASTWGYRESEDVKHAVDFALARPSVRHVVVYGFSIGAAAVAHAAATDPRPAAAVLCAAWTSLHEEISHKLGMHAAFGRLPTELGYRLSGVDVSAVKATTDVPKIAPRPLLVIEGGADRDTPPFTMERVFAAAGEPKGILRVPGADHGEVIRKASAEWERTVVAFLSRAVGGEISAARFPR